MDFKGLALMALMWPSLFACAGGLSKQNESADHRCSLSALYVNMFECSVYRVCFGSVKFRTYHHNPVSK